MKARHPRLQQVQPKPEKEREGRGKMGSWEVAGKSEAVKEKSGG